MSRPALSLLLASMLLLPAGCAFFDPLTGRSAAGGAPAVQSVLLGIPLPAGMEYYPSHSAVSGDEGVEVLRGSAAPATCAMAVAQAMLDQGWRVRLSKTAGARAWYLFERDASFAVVHVRIQTPPGMTLVEIAKGRALPDGATFAMPRPPAQGAGQPAASRPQTEPAYSSQPLNEGASQIQGRDI
ncbi:MAG: hypothetical protein II132_02495 [Desulfovibrio sp.]|nr:hypothetical protein [Desulfovibrio sp.]